MKCFIHQSEDAIGVCKSCGKGVCSYCSVSVSSIIYCRDCAPQYPPESSTGMYDTIPKQQSQFTGFPPPPPIPPQYFSYYPLQMPKPLSPEAQRDYLIGSIGSILTGIFIIAMLGISSMYLFFSYFFYGGINHFIIVVIILFSVLTTVSLILSGIGFYGIYRVHKRLAASSSFIISLILPIIFMIIMVTSVGLIFSYYYFPIYIISGVVLGVYFIIIGSMIIVMRRCFVASGHATAGGILILVGGAISCSIILCMPGLIVVTIGEFIWASVLLRERGIWKVRYPLQWPSM